MCGQRLAKPVDLAPVELEPGGRSMPAVAVEMLRAGVERGQQVEALDAPPRALGPPVPVDCEHDRGTLVAVDEPRGDDPDHAGMPAFAGDDEESRSQRYEFQFRTKYDLKLASYRVLEADSSAEVLQGTLSDVTGGAPASIAFDLSSAGEGWYVLVVDCLYKGRSGGPQRSFRFYRAD